MGGVYSADGQIVVREGRGHHGYNVAQPTHKHHHHAAHHHQHRHANEKKMQKGHDGRRWPEPDERRCEHHWKESSSRQQRRQELIPRAKLRQRSPDYSKWEDPVRPLRHTVSFCGKFGPQNQLNQQIKQAGGVRGIFEKKTGGGSCTLRREAKRAGMEKAEDSTESGYDGGSLENILSDPQPVSRKKDDNRTSSSGRKVSRQEKMEPAKEREEEKKPSLQINVQDISHKMANGCADYCNVAAQRNQENKKEIPFEGNKVTIHAVIETVHNGREEESEVHNDSSESEDLYEKIEDVREIKPEKTYVPKERNQPKEDIFENDSDDSSHESNKEVVYSHISIHRTVKKADYNAGKCEDKTMIQELVKVAEDEGAPVKIPSPPPMRNMAKSQENIFVEEEYSYEPELKKSSSKLVLRTRSLLNLDEENTKSDRGYVRPPAIRMKITTGPDGTFVIDGRKATSELNLSDESRNGSPKEKRSYICGEDLKKRKEEIFKPKDIPKQDAKKIFDEINQNKTRTTKEEAIYNLKKYLKENNIGLKDLLTNNNVVIIDTYREKKVTEDLSDYNHKAAGDCRITGTTAKGEVHESHTLPRANRVHQPVVQRHYFYNLFKQKPNPPDEELPDPDKVRSTRQMFQSSKEKVPPVRIMLPIAAKVGNPKKEPRPTNEVRVINQGSPRRWTDSGSVSSGVSSDMSVLDTMSDKCYSSEDEEDDLDSPIIDTHPISPEVLKKIRECGTTITYYGGRVIAHSHGPGNPMTMTIMDEIRQGREGGCKGKFRLIKSNSCGSRLELAGTDDSLYQEMSRNRFYEDLYGGTPLSEEIRGSLRTVQEEIKEDQLKNEHKKKKEKAEKKSKNNSKNKWENKMEQIGNEKKPSWRELIESRKQRKAMEHNRRPCPDMVFEEFQVLET